MGPIIWGLIGLVVGLVSGFFIKWLYIKNKYKRSLNKSKTEVFLIVYTKEETKVQNIKEILWQHNAQGLTVYSGHSITQL